MPFTTNDVFLMHQTFFIYNKKYDDARIAQWGKKGREVGTYGGKKYQDQLWTLEPHSSFDGHFYIRNVNKEGYVIAKWGGADREVGVYTGQAYEDQLWRFEKQDDGHYLIYNKHYPNSRITKWGAGDSDWGTYDGDIFEDQMWKLVPRFDIAFKEQTLLHSDNACGTSDKSEKIKLITGIKSNNTEMMNKDLESIKTSMENTLQVVGKEQNIDSGILNDLFAQMKRLKAGYEPIWSSTEEVNVNVPKEKTVSVSQTVVVFTSTADGLEITLHGSHRVDEKCGM